MYYARILVTLDEVPETARYLDELMKACGISGAVSVNEYHGKKWKPEKVRWVIAKQPNTRNSIRCYKRVTREKE